MRTLIASTFIEATSIYTHTVDNYWSDAMESHAITSIANPKNSSANL